MPALFLREPPWRLQHNILVVTRRYAAICASGQPLRVAMQRCASPRDCRFALFEFSNRQIQSARATGPTAQSKKPDACKAVRTTRRSLAGRSVDTKYPAASVFFVERQLSPG